jgi:hypothetical protein
MQTISEESAQNYFVNQDSRTKQISDLPIDLISDLPIV